MPEESSSAPLLRPAHEIPPDRDARAPEEGTALCLSGGGYRAMLFHLGALWRLNEAGLLRELKRVSRVSGGSIAAGVLGLKWRSLGFGEDGSRGGSTTKWSCVRVELGEALPD